MLQYAADGLVMGAAIALGAIGLTLTYSILNFANFTHGDLLTWGAYFVLTFLSAMAGFHAGPTFGALSFGWPFVLAVVASCLLTALLALALDWSVFGRLRSGGHDDATRIAVIIASFGVSLGLRNLLVFIHGPKPDYYSREIQFAIEVVPGVRITPDQMLVLALTVVLVFALHLLLSRTTLGRAMRATRENPSLARVIGIDVRAVVRWTWMIGGALAAIAGIFIGLTIQVRPELGFDLLLTLFAAAILGGIGSVYGAVAGGLLIGLAESFSVPLIGAEYRQAVAFLVLITVLLVRPRGLFGEKAE